MKQLRPILPALRQSNRYLVYEVRSTRPFNWDMKDSLDKELRRFLGEYGYALANIRHMRGKRYGDTYQGMIRVSDRCLDHLRAGLSLVTHLNNKPVAIRSVGVSGSVQQAKSRYLNITEHETGC